MKYLYIRVSTKIQIKGNSIEDQMEQLKKEYPDGVLIIEQYTGSKVHRPKFQEILDKIQPGDTLVVTKLDRLARNLGEGNEVISSLLNKGVRIHILNMGLLDSSATGKLMYQMLLAFAEFERAMIIERTQAGKEVAKSKPGFREGRPPKYNSKQYEMVDLLRKEGKSYNEICDMLGMSKGAVYRHLKKKELEEMNK